ncbi:MAG: tRNA uridine-5-carboxymethylaminomethyl(34) synthesis GTPase MnmE [Rubellimicrobium sp.]|nr:tRNA uridine-5-carboxymethylaminomethyl(34) synthesis GTPase MnmE [Rubellimicrobium sp.]
MTDTIFALATAPGRAGVAVIRVSGPDAFSAVTDLVGPRGGADRSLRRIRDHAGDVLDEGLVLWFDEGHSFTGEPVVELQIHGSPAGVSAVLRCLGLDRRLRPAEPGEFTRRALENGRLDISQVEALADLLDAETEAQRRQAVRVFSGALGALTERWRGDLIRAAALVEASIDFADEDVPDDLGQAVLVLLDGLIDELETQVAGVRVAERIRDGFEVAIVGPPNVGKSTLLNSLAGREAAITSERAGTTRDVIEVRLDLQGLPVTFLDTAGLRTSEDEVEVVGIARAIERADAADLRVHLTEPGGAPILDVREGDVVVAGRGDITGLGVSGKTGFGVDELVSAISSHLAGRAAGAGIAMRERHRVAMVRAIDALSAARMALQDGGAVELIAERLREAGFALDTLVGRVDVEHLLSEIFSSFCIGK